MYDDDVQAPLSIGAGDRYYKAAKFPTRNIKTPIVLVYGGSDSLVDIAVMLRELPRHTVAKEIPHFEHLDFLWAQEVDTLVFPHVFEALDAYAGTDHSKMRPFTYKALQKGSHLAIAGPPSYSDDDRASFTTATSDVENDARTAAVKECAPSSEPRSARYVPSIQTPNNSNRFSRWSSPSFHHPAPTTGAGVTDIPTPARSGHLRSSSLMSNTKNKRSNSLANRISWDSAASAKKYRDNSIAIGASKAIINVSKGTGDETSASDGGKK